MMAIRRYRRRILTFLIGLIGGSAILSGPAAPDARAKERSSEGVNKDYTIDSKTQISPDSRVVVANSKINVMDSRERMSPPNSRIMYQELPEGVQQDLFNQQQEILLKMEELKQMMDQLQLKLNTLQQNPNQN